MLADVDKSRGGRPSETCSTVERVSYGELGIGRTQAHRWQLSAALPDEDFEGYVAATRDAGRELTSAAVQKLAPKTPAQKDDAAVATLPAGTVPVNSRGRGKHDGEAATIAAASVGIGGQAVQRAKKVQQSAPDMFERMKRDEVSVNARAGEPMTNGPPRRAARFLPARGGARRRAPRLYPPAASADYPL